MVMQCVSHCVYERCGMEPSAHGVKCGVVEWVKVNTLKWFGHMERKRNEVFMKKVYVNETECPRREERKASSKMEG